MLQCIPIRDLKSTTLISEMCHANDEPIMITKNGYQDMVIMSAEVYECIRLISTYEKLAAIEKEPIPEDVQEAQRLLKTLMEKYHL